MARIIISSLMKSGPGKAAPSAPPPQPTPDVGGGFGDICSKSLDKDRRVHWTGCKPSAQTAPKQDGGLPDLGPRPGYQIPTGDQKSRVPTDSGGQLGPGGDILAQIMRELAKAIEEGRPPVVVGPVTIGVPEQTVRPAGTRLVQWAMFSDKSCEIC